MVLDFRNTIGGVKLHQHFIPFYGKFYYVKVKTKKKSLSSMKFYKNRKLAFQWYDRMVKTLCDLEDLEKGGKR